MAMNYDLKADQVLKMLGYSEPMGEHFVNVFEQENHIKLPQCLKNFYTVAYNCPLLSTADIWTDRMWFLYEAIEEEIEEYKEVYGDNPEEGADDEYYQFTQFLSKIPREQWAEHVTNYLEIGSDYGAGVVIWGISIADLDKEDPPVYYLHEENEITDWEPLGCTLSEFFMLVVCDAILCRQYQTAQRVLKQTDIHCQLEDYDEVEATAKKLGLDTSAFKNQVLSWGKVVCGYDEDRNLLLVADINDNYNQLFRVCTLSVRK